MPQQRLQERVQAWPAPRREHAGYFTVPGAHLYTVLHQVQDPVARILLVGPFAAERQFAYQSWARWARFLAARQIEVLRYDYRGVGESTGTFEEMDFKTWSSDTESLVNWFESRSPSVPLVLHGLEIGAILAARCFEKGAAQALLLWAPALTANQALRSTLRRWAGVEQFYESPKNRKSASEYIRELEQGSAIDVYGYKWTEQLWRDSVCFDLPAEMRNPEHSGRADGRPVRVISFGKTADSLTMPYKRYEEEQDLEWLYASTFAWLAKAVPILPGESNAGKA